LKFNSQNACWWSKHDPRNRLFDTDWRSEDEKNLCINCAQETQRITARRAVERSLWHPKALWWCCNPLTHLISHLVTSFDMDMSYTKVLHIEVAYRVPHKWRHAFYVTRPLICARITCYVTVITHGRCYARA
jgi:hypothetical protein